MHQMKSQTVDPALQPSTGKELAPDEGAKPSRVLIVQHDAAVASVLEVAIGLEHEAFVAPDLASAVCALRNRRYDAIVLDVGLPHGNALRVLNHVRHHLGLETPVMFISGLRSRLAAPEPVEGRGYAADSFSPTELLGQIQELLREARYRSIRARGRVRSLPLRPGPTQGY